MTPVNDPKSAEACTPATPLGSDTLIEIVVVLARLEHSPGELSQIVAGLALADTDGPDVSAGSVVVVVLLVVVVVVVVLLVLLVVVVVLVLVLVDVLAGVVIGVVVGVVLVVGTVVLVSGTTVEVVTWITVGSTQPLMGRSSKVASGITAAASIQTRSAKDPGRRSSTHSPLASTPVATTRSPARSSPAPSASGQSKTGYVAVAIRRGATGAAGATVEVDADDVAGAAIVGSSSPVVTMPNPTPTVAATAASPVQAAVLRLMIRSRS